MTTQQRVTIGRDPSCTIVVNDEYASPLHASITKRPDGSLWIEDEGSTNGVWVNGARAWVPVRVDHGTRIRIGHTEVTIP